jgi:hypothetical protein
MNKFVQIWLILVLVGIATAVNLCAYQLKRIADSASAFECR